MQRVYNIFLNYFFMCLIIAPRWAIKYYLKHLSTFPPTKIYLILSYKVAGSVKIQDVINYCI